MEYIVIGRTNVIGHTIVIGRALPIQMPMLNIGVSSILMYVVYHGTIDEGES